MGVQMTITSDMSVEVRGEDIVITAPGTDHLAIYSKSANRIAFGPLDFRVQAWTLATHKAQELGWLGPVWNS
jgi:hypothetical protein